MGYRDDFYCKENILGYTGKLRDNPTIYFADAGGSSPKLEMVDGQAKVLVSFGHITQAHDTAGNVGRARVRESYSYTICNVLDTSIPGLDNATGKLVAQECVYGQRELDKAGLRGYETDPNKSREDQHLDWHVSRNKFEEVTPGSRAILAAAIDNHKDMKEARYA